MQNIQLPEHLVQTWTAKLKLSDEIPLVKHII